MTTRLPSKRVASRIGLPGWRCRGPCWARSSASEPAIAPGNEATEQHLDEIVQQLGFSRLHSDRGRVPRRLQKNNHAIRHYSPYRR